jgi:hypothetical protein
MTNLVFTLDATSLSSPRRGLRASPKKSPSKNGRARLRSSLSANSGAPKAIVRTSFDENVPNRSESPLQFEFSPAQLRVAPMRALVSPSVAMFSESDSESLSFSSRSSSSSDVYDSNMQLDTSAHHEDEQVDRITSAPAPVVPANKPGVPAGGSRRFLSMSANNFLSRKSPVIGDDDVDMDAPVKKASPVKKNLFAAITEDEEEVASKEEVLFTVSDAQPFRWERSASMVELTLSAAPFAVPAAAAPR